MLYKASVESGTLDLIKKLSAVEKFNQFNLVGGTALALQIGHRISEDIDLFRTRAFNVPEIAGYLKDKYKAEEIQTFKDGILSFIDKVKVDMFTHPYDWLSPPKNI